MLIMIGNLAPQMSFFAWFITHKNDCKKVACDTKAKQIHKMLISFCEKRLLNIIV